MDALVNLKGTGTMVTSTEQAIEAIRLRAKENGFKMNDIAAAAGVDPAQLSRLPPVFGLYWPMAQADSFHPLTV